MRKYVVVAALSVGLLSLPLAAAHAKQTHPPWHVTIRTDTTQTSVGTTIHITGRVARSAAGRRVMLQVRFGSNKRWRDLRKALVHADGSYATYDVPRVNNVRRYRVMMPATTKHSRGVSPSVRVVVYTWEDLTSLPAVNIDNLRPVSSVVMNGTTFDASLEAHMRSDGTPTSQSIEYNLDHKCLMFQGDFGISDDSARDGQASVTASADGTPWFSEMFMAGQSQPQANSFTWDPPPQQIRFDTESLNASANGLGAVGTPQVYCTQ
jgi:hypothetical protein